MFTSPAAPVRALAYEPVADSRSQINSGHLWFIIFEWDVTGSGFLYLKQILSPFFVISENLYHHHLLKVTYSMLLKQVLLLDPWKLYFYWLFIVALTARSYRDCHCCFCLGMVLIDTMNLSRHMRFFFMHGRQLPGHGSQVVFRPCAAAVNYHNIGQPHLLPVTHEISPLMADIYRAVSKVVFRPSPMWTTMKSDNPSVSYYIISDYSHLLGNLSIRSPLFWQLWSQISRKSNIKLYQ